MAEKIKLKVSPAVAAFVGPGVSTDVKLRGIGAADTLSANDQVKLCYCLMKDADSIVREAALCVFTSVADETLLSFIASPEVHPAILDAIARFHHATQDVTAALLKQESLSLPARNFLLASQSVSDKAKEADAADDDGDDGDDDGEVCDALLLDEMVDPDAEPEGTGDEVEEPVEESEEFRSKYQLSRDMGISQKIKMALTGDKEWRAILIKDANKLVSGAVVRNPRITDGEILNILKVGVQNDEIIRVICANKEWVKNYKIRKGLVECPKTPLPNALRYLATLSDKEIASYAKSKNISSVISTQAKRLVMNKK